MSNDVVQENVPPDVSADPRRLAARLGVVFRDIALLETALTHSSRVPEKMAVGARNYEALEFLGDAVLQLAISHHLFERLPERTPGEYTKLRATLVNRNSVARVAKRIDIGPYIRLGKGEEIGGGRKRVALLADCLEAIVGAVYLDMGWESARALVIRMFLSDMEDIERAEPTWDYKSLLQNHCQAKRFGLPRFEVVRSEGPDHRKEFEMEVYVSNQPAGRGIGMSKKEAEQKAAHEALRAMNIIE